MADDFGHRGAIPMRPTGLALRVPGSRRPFLVACHERSSVRPRKLALLFAPLMLLATLPGAVTAAQPTDGRAAYHAKVQAYWTPQRIRNAKPRDFTFDAVKGFQPNARPGGGGTGNVTGASWTGGGDIVKISGKVLFTMGGSDYICSGTVVTETNSNVSVVLTAGHCVVENDGTFATFWEFIPSFDTNGTYTCTASKYGCWVADSLYAHKTFATAGGFNDTAVRYDWGFARVSTGGLSGTAKLDSTVGSLAIQYSGVAKTDTLWAFGYPAAGKYHGYDLTYCKGPIGTDANAGNATWSVPCDMTGGSSGGPWVETGDPTLANGTVLSSLNSYGYSGVKNMYGPKFNPDTKGTFDDAVAGTLGSNTVRVVFP
jgi:hypothetical protein